jgi:hypothetical protein
MTVIGKEVEVVVSPEKPKSLDCTLAHMSDDFITVSYTRRGPKELTLPMSSVLEIRRRVDNPDEEDEDSAGNIVGKEISLLYFDVETSITGAVRQMAKAGVVIEYERHDKRHGTKRHVVFVPAHRLIAVKDNDPVPSSGDGEEDQDDDS